MLGLFGSRRTAVFLVSWARALLHYCAWVWRYSIATVLSMILDIAHL